MTPVGIHTLEGGGPVLGLMCLRSSININMCYHLLLFIVLVTVAV